MLSDEDKARIAEEEKIKMEVRKESVRGRCCAGTHCSRHCWFKTIGIVIIAVIVIGLFCHHGDKYHSSQAALNKNNPVITQ